MGKFCVKEWDKILYYTVKRFFPKTSLCGGLWLDYVSKNIRTSKYSSNFGANDHHYHRTSWKVTTHKFMVHLIFCYVNAVFIWVLSILEFSFQVFIFFLTLINRRSLEGVARHSRYCNSRLWSWSGNFCF